MSDVVYLFGAGASIGAVPVVENMVDDINELIQLLGDSSLRLKEDAFVFDDTKDKKTYLDYQNEMIDDFKWMRDGANAHASIDTYAKKLFLIKSSELRRLKIIMSVYFYIKQAGNKIDKRYDAFFASIMERRNIFSKHIKLISWNYDWQFELALLGFEESSQYELAMDRLGLRYKGQFYDTTPNRLLYKLNGTLGFFKSGSESNMIHMLHPGQELNRDGLAFIVSQYVMFKKIKTYRPLLSFAWESDSGQINIIDDACKYVSKAETLVVIGYSFPFFNRKIDQEIFGEENMPNLNRIYIQNPRAEGVYESFKAIRDDLDNDYMKVSLLQDQNPRQFHMPSEL